MRKKLIVSCMAVALAAGIAGTCIAVHAAETSVVITTGQTPRPLRLLFSGQTGRLLTLRSELNITSEQRQQIKRRQRRSPDGAVRW